MVMDDRVIEAAERAMEEQVVPWEDPDVWSGKAAEAAVTAALRALEPELRAAVNALIWATCDVVFAVMEKSERVEEYRRKEAQATGAIFALLGLDGDA
jgi:hypothetical protein